MSAEVEGVGWGGCQPVSAQTIRRTLHPISRSRRKPLLKEDAQESLQTVC